MKKMFLVTMLIISSLASIASANREWSDALYDRNGDIEKYFDSYCGNSSQRRCFNIKEESAIADAIKSTGQDIYTVVFGDNVIVMNKNQYYGWQESMANNLAKAGLSTLHLATAIPFKLVSGLVVSIAGVFWSPFEKKGEMGNLARRGVGLLTKSIGDIPTDVIGLLDGLTLGGGVYVVMLPFSAGQAVTGEVEAGLR